MVGILPLYHLLFIKMVILNLWPGSLQHSRRIWEASLLGPRTVKDSNPNRERRHQAGIVEQSEEKKPFRQRENKST